MDFERVLELHVDVDKIYLMLGEPVKVVLRASERNGNFPPLNCRPCFTFKYAARLTSHELPRPPDFDLIVEPPKGWIASQAREALSVARSRPTEAVLPRTSFFEKVIMPQSCETFTGRASSQTELSDACNVVRLQVTANELQAHGLRTNQSARGLSKAIKLCKYEVVITSEESVLSEAGVAQVSLRCELRDHVSPKQLQPMPDMPLVVELLTEDNRLIPPGPLWGMHGDGFATRSSALGVATGRDGAVDVRIWMKPNPEFANFRVAIAGDVALENKLILTKPGCTRTFSPMRPRLALPPPPRFHAATPAYLKSFLDECCLSDDNTGILTCVQCYMVVPKNGQWNIQHRDSCPFINLYRNRRLYLPPEPQPLGPPPPPMPTAQSQRPSQIIPTRI